MKFLLTALNAKYIHSCPAIYSLRSYVQAYHPAAAQCVELAEYTINRPMGEILADIYKRKPDVIGFSCYIWNWERMRELAAEVHKLLPQVPIWLGGPEVSYDAEHILEQYSFVTGIMVGEGEVTFAELLESYWNCGLTEQLNAAAQAAKAIGQRSAEAARQQTHPDLRGISGLHGIPGLVFRDVVTGEVVRTGERELTDISKLPFFYENLKAFENRILYYESSRGCPFSCSYCLSSIDKKVRLRDMELVKKELQFFLDEKVPQVKFVDRTFNCNHAHAQEIWRYILEHDNGVTNFHFEVSADLLNDDELTLLSKMRPGLVQLEIGVQSTNIETLKAVRRYTDLEKLRQKVAAIRAAENVHVHLDLIAGLPFEDYASFRKSFDDVYAMKPEQLQLGFLKVLKGSYMAEMEKEWGIVYTDCPPYEVLFTKWLSYEDVIRLKAIEEMVELYYNSNQFAHVLPVLEKAFQSPFAMFEALAAFFSEKGYFVNSPSRAYRYQVLLDFAKEADPARESLYRELLVYDMYLRENCKSRPAFAREQGDRHDAVLSFYKKEEEQRRILTHRAYEGCQARQLERMTHLEVFCWPPEEEPQELLTLFDRETSGAKAAQKESTEQWILFDYQVRSPLTMDARTVIIE